MRISDWRSDVCSSDLDFMPIRGQAPDIVRIVEGLEGSVAMHSELGLRFDYGRTHPLVRSRTACEAVGIAGSNAVKLCWDVPIERTERRFRRGLPVRDGARVCFFERKDLVSGKSVSVGVDQGVRSI